MKGLKKHDLRFLEGFFTESFCETTEVTNPSPFP